jgi:hypothetical protein
MTRFYIAEMILALEETHIWGTYTGTSNRTTSSSRPTGIFASRILGWRPTCNGRTIRLITSIRGRRF